VAAALSYVLGFISGIVFLVLEKDSFVRFHAFQSIMFSVAWMVLSFALSFITGVATSSLTMVALAGASAAGVFAGFVSLFFGLVGLALGIGGLVLWVLLMVRASQGQRWKLPYIGDVAERYAAQPA
jgi:uncharacterized membrane protein